MMNFEQMTLGEIEEIELLIGRSIDEVFADGQPKGRALRVLYFVAMKKDNPGYKFEDTESVSQSEALKILSGTDPKGNK
jgi:hypothetical protein